MMLYHMGYNGALRAIDEKNKTTTPKTFQILLVRDFQETPEEI